MTENGARPLSKRFSNAKEECSVVSSDQVWPLAERGTFGTLNPGYARITDIQRPRLCTLRPRRTRRMCKYPPACLIEVDNADLRTCAPQNYRIEKGTLHGSRSSSPRRRF